VSYSSLRRRGGSNEPADAHARRVPAGLHEGSAADFLRRHGRESAGAARGPRGEKAALVAVLFRRAADPRNLKLAFDHIARGGGAAGPDGIFPSDLAPCGGHPVPVRPSLIAGPPPSRGQGSIMRERSAPRKPGRMGSGTAWTTGRQVVPGEDRPGQVDESVCRGEGGAGRASDGLQVLPRCGPGHAWPTDRA
jgi:hypothetical protein